jgi:magnesium-transporting ATPase (P-type)
MLKFVTAGSICLGIFLTLTILLFQRAEYYEEDGLSDVREILVNIQPLSPLQVVVIEVLFASLISVFLIGKREGEIKMSEDRQKHNIHLFYGRGSQYFFIFYFFFFLFHFIYLFIFCLIWLMLIPE